MSNFSLWCKARTNQIVLCVVLLAVFSIVEFLYAFSAEIILLSISCGSIVLIPFAFNDYSKFNKKHNALKREKETIYSEEYKLPKSDNAIEEDYEEIILNLIDEKARIKADVAVYKENMDDYYSLWTHQVKTPIAAMRLLMQTSDGNIDESGISELENELFKIEQYVELAMNYQKPDSSINDLTLKSYDLDEIIKHAIRKYSKQFIRAKISLNYSPVDFKVVTDEKWLGFVFEQIISNAIKYTKEGSLSIYMTDDEKVVFEDSGIGIEKEDLPRIFEKGYTGYNGRTDKKSTGIGLYLCKRVITMLGHKISAESEPNKGTKIIVDLNIYNLKVE